MSKRRTFGQLSENARRRATLSGERYGLTRKQVRDRYNRGTFNPFSRTRPELRVPREVREYTAPSGEVDWHEAALANVRRQLSDYFKYNDFDVVDNIYSHASDAALRAMAMANEDELIAIAYVQSESESATLPFGLTPSDIGFYRNGKWNNIFWYH